MQLIVSQEVLFMTALKQTAMKELEKLPDDKVNFILQIMQGVNGLYNDNQSEKKKHLNDQSRCVRKELSLIMIQNQLDIKRPAMKSQA